MWNGHIVRRVWSGDQPIEMSRLCRAF
jgi:hypothetical protein